MLVAAAAVAPVDVENADEAEFGLPAPGLAPAPELAVAALRAVAAVALAAPKLLMLVAALRLPGFTAGIAGGGPLAMPISASAAASILACDQPAWAADISGVSSDLCGEFGGGEGRGGREERFRFAVVVPVAID